MMFFVENELHLTSFQGLYTHVLGRRKACSSIKMPFEVTLIQYPLTGGFKLFSVVKFYC